MLWYQRLAYKKRPQSNMWPSTTKWVALHNFHKMSLIVDRIEQHLPFPMSYCLKKYLQYFKSDEILNTPPVQTQKLRKSTFKMMHVFSAFNCNNMFLIAFEIQNFAIIL